MAADLGQCDVCKGKLAIKEKKEVSGTLYNIIQCEKCKKEVIRKTD